ncbi:MAG: biopolymer transporter ExbD [Candidatus Thiodiazotropha sp.]
MFTKFRDRDEADLDITPFMNLMIVLVPVLLLSMVFSQITILKINLPELTGSTTQSAEKNQQLEVVLRKSAIEVYYPSGVLVKKIETKHTNSGDKLDFGMLSLVLREIKKQVKSKSDVLLLTEANVDYQSLVSTMDTVKGFTTVVAASAVKVELFPEISLGDAPLKGGKS